jgi:hypothetical protein
VSKYWTFLSRTARNDVIHAIRLGASSGQIQATACRGLPALPGAPCPATASTANALHAKGNGDRLVP